MASTHERSRFSGPTNDGEKKKTKKAEKEMNEQCRAKSVNIAFCT